MSGKSLDQMRAASAWRYVQRKSGEYKNLAKSLPALIMSNGLMQSLAFLKAKGKEHHTDLGNQICKYVLQVDTLEEGLEKLHSMKGSQYRRATEEAIEVLKWIRQLADAVIE
ncbi:MAG: hypothetical protein Kow0025_20300 [Thermodesulfovibrionales bacterium]